MSQALQTAEMFLSAKSSSSEATQRLELVKGVITVLEVEFVLSCIHSLNQWPQDCPGHWREKSSPGGHESHPLQVLLLFKHLVLCQILLEL